MGLNEPYLPLNDPLFFASEVGGYYPGMWPLFSGAMLFAQSKTVQVINPATGAALAAAPPLPRNNYWEYPLSGSQVLLRQPHTMPNSDTTLWFMVFGGGYQAGVLATVKTAIALQQHMLLLQQWQMLSSSSSRCATHTILACRYDLYLQHGPVLCEEKAGTGVQLVDGRVQKISVLWKDSTPTHLQPRMDIFRLKPSFAQ